MIDIKVKILIVCIAVVTLAVLKVYIDNFTFEINYFLIKIKSNFKNSILSKSKFSEKVIVHISDLHSRFYGENNSKLISAIDKINPDYVFLTGDMVNADDSTFESFESLIKAIGLKYKCFYITGNHELEIKDMHFDSYLKLKNLLKNYRVTFLCDESVELENDVVLYGLSYFRNRDDEKNDIVSVQDIENRLGKVDERKFNILLAHNPIFFETYAKWGADLVFSGHIHGGMIRILGQGIFSPTRVLFPKYTGGKIYESKDYNNSQLILSRGLSAGRSGFRFFNTPELIVARFK